MHRWWVAELHFWPLDGVCTDEVEIVCAEMTLVHASDPPPRTSYCGPKLRYAIRAAAVVASRRVSLCILIRFDEVHSVNVMFTLSFRSSCDFPMDVLIFARSDCWVG